MSDSTTEAEQTMRELSELFLYWSGQPEYWAGSLGRCDARLCRLTTTGELVTLEAHCAFDVPLESIPKLLYQ